MKYFLQIILLTPFFFTLSTSLAQQKINAHLYSRQLQQTVNYSVYLPADRDTAQLLPVLYTFSYGMVDGDYVAAQLNYYQSAHYILPHTILVNIKMDMDRIGYLYTTGLLTPTGKAMVNCLRQEIIPLIEKQYHTAGFRSYMGHSYAASYANYLFQYEPGLFNGYILLAPEKIATDQPPFNITPTLKDWYNHHTTFYYIGVGENDMDRRRAYAREIQEKLKAIDSTHLWIRYDSIPNADHANILSLSMQAGIEHLYQLYNPYLETGNEHNTLKELEQTIARVKASYDITPQKNPIYYNRFLQLAIANKDTTAFQKLLQYFDDGKGKPWYLMQFGFYCAQLKLNALASKYLNKAIQNIQQKENDPDLKKGNLIACYIQLANMAEETNTARAWTYLQQAKALSLHPSPKGHQFIDTWYELGKFSATRQYQLLEGIKALETFNKLAQDISPDAHGLDYRKPFFYLGKCHLLLNHYPEARAYLNTELHLHPTNKEAIQLLQSIP